MGSLDRKGYGDTYVTVAKHVAVHAKAHRVVYEALVGPIPPGLELDHVKARGCASRACCNPDHLEPVTGTQNKLRGDSFSGVNARKTHCPAGHPLAEGNLVPHFLKKGGRVCLTCRRAATMRCERKRRHLWPSRKDRAYSSAAK